MELFGIAGIVAAVLFVIGVKAINNLIYICGPNEVLIFSGSKTKVGNRMVGYTTVKGGRGIRVPLIETVHRMDLTNMTIDVHVTSAYSKGGIPLNVQGVANVKIAGDDPLIHNALERLLGKSREAIMRIAKETLEGNLRGVLATLTPEQVNEDKMAFAQSLLVEAEHDLATLGLVLDTLKIQNVTDDQGYLQAIGRKQSAELSKRARIAEADARATADITAASNEERTAMADITAQIEIVKAESSRRIMDARTKRAAVVAEQNAAVAAQVAKAQGEMEVQRARIEQVRRQLEAETVAPAAARQQTMAYQAEGEAAKIVADAQARAGAINEILAVWNQHGAHAKQVMLLQKLENIVDIVTGAMKPVQVDQVTFIGGGVPEGEGGLAIKAISALEQLKLAAGIDLAPVLQNLARPPSPPPEAQPKPRAPEQNRPPPELSPRPNNPQAQHPRPPKR